MFYVQNGLEITDHLFLHCPIARCLLYLACSYLGLHGVMPSSVSYQLSSGKVFLREEPSLKSSEPFLMLSYGYCGWREIVEFLMGWKPP